MIEKALAWFYARKGRVSYSMANRNGPNSYDCSSSVYHALKEAGLLPASYWIGNTDTLFDALEKNGWVKVPIDANGNADTQRGDIFIWGIRGNSGGALGHTGMFIDPDNIINCRYQAGIVIDNHDWLWNASDRPPYTFYRYVGKPILTPQRRVALPEVYYADEVATVFDIRQIRCNRLTHAFDWEDNGIPVAVATKVDRDGYLMGGDINTGDYFRLVGGMHVINEEVENNYKYLQVKMGEENVWILAERARNIAENDFGTPRPNTRPLPVPPPKTPEATPKAEDKPKEKPLAPQPTNEDIMREIGKVNQNITSNRNLLEKILAGINAIVEFLGGLFKGFKK